MDEPIVLGESPPGPGMLHRTFELPLSALTHHMCVLGTTGTGKSTFASILAYELGKRGVPTVVLDRTGEYSSALAKFAWARVYRPGGNLVMALFQRDAATPLSVQVEGWVSLLNHYTTASYGAPLSPLQQRVLREILRGYYGGTAGALTISRLISKLEKYEEEVRRLGGWEESIEALISRLVPLTVDVIGSTLDQPYTSLKLDSLFEGVVSVLDLSPLGVDAAKNLLSQLILKRVYDRMRAMPMTGELRIVMVVDEAQHLAPNGDYVGVPELCAMELRKYGFSLVMLATRPTLISSNVLSNCGTVVSHMLTSDRDLRTVADHIVGGFDNDSLRVEIRKLPIGHAMVQQNYPAPQRPMFYRIGVLWQRAELGLIRLEPAAPREPGVSPSEGRRQG